MLRRVQNLVILLLLLFVTVTSFAQLKDKKGILAGLTGDFTVNGYVDTYIAYDNDKNSAPRQFSSIAPYRDEFRLNMAMIAVRYNSEKVRGNVAIHFGDIPKINWPQAPNDYLQFVQEANLGFSPAKNFWIDAGLFLTHIGGEGIIPKYNFFQSQSLCTYYEPFYQSGIRFSYTGNKFYGALFLLNGFNVFNDNNKNKSAGIQLGYKPNKKVEVTYNNIIGNEMPAGTEGKTRIYNNLVIKLWPWKKIDIIGCGDFCLQEKSKITDPTSSASMFSGFLALKYHITNKFSVALRGEMIQDKDGILSGIVRFGFHPAGLEANGYSGALEYNPTDNSYFRIESRLLIAGNDQPIFSDKLKNYRVEVILSGGMEF
jgi:hypothetical protein